MARKSGYVLFSVTWSHSEYESEEEVRDEFTAPVATSVSMRNRVALGKIARRHVARLLRLRGIAVVEMRCITLHALQVSIVQHKKLSNLERTEPRTRVKVVWVYQGQRMHPSILTMVDPPLGSIQEFRVAFLEHAKPQLRKRLRGFPGGFLESQVKILDFMPVGAAQ